MLDWVPAISLWTTPKSPRSRAAIVVDVADAAVVEEVTAVTVAATVVEIALSSAPHATTTPTVELLGAVTAAVVVALALAVSAAGSRALAPTVETESTSADAVDRATLSAVKMDLNNRPPLLL